MDNIDEGMIKLTNHNDHPTNKAYKVFFFYKEEQSNFFKKILEEENIFYEYGEDENRGASRKGQGKGLKPARLGDRDIAKDGAPRR